MLNEKQEFIIDSMDINMIIKENYEQIHTHKFDDLDEMD